MIEHIEHKQFLAVKELFQSVVQIQQNTSDAQTISIVTQIFVQSWCSNANYFSENNKKNIYNKRTYKDLKQKNYLISKHLKISAKQSSVWSEKKYCASWTSLSNGARIVVGHLIIRSERSERKALCVRCCSKSETETKHSHCPQ